MSSVTKKRESEPVRLELGIWHPNCWTLEVTETSDAGLIVRGVYTIDDEVHARVTAHGPSIESVASLVDAIDASPRTDDVKSLNAHLEFDQRGPAGKATTELLVRYPDTDSIYEAMLEQEFFPDEEIRINDGIEYWTVVTGGSRPEIRRRLDDIRDAVGADIEVLHIATSDVDGRRDNDSPMAVLSNGQREAIQLARHNGYYEWPRQTSATELAEEFGVSKATFLEHLRKAESKLLDAKESR